MPYENILYEIKDHIAKITINRPKVLNALNLAVLSELKTAVEEAGKDKEAGVIVLTGADRAFSAGVDISSPPELVEAEREMRSTVARALIDTIQSLPKVVIAMVPGYCLTGALEIALSCDLIIASDEAKFGDTHARWGLHPRWGMSQRLPRTVGLLKAKELSFTTDIITAQQAEKIGLVNMVVPTDKLELTVRQIAGKILKNSPEAIAIYKYLYNQNQKDALKKGLELEAKTELKVQDLKERLEKFSKKG